jgi:membrane protein implicated in regulation of membrane protease activity
MAWSLNATYILCIVAGFGYLIVSFLLGHIGLGHGGHDGAAHGHLDSSSDTSSLDLGDVAAQEYHGAAAEAAIEAHEGEHAAGEHIGPWSPMIMATFIFFFGCTGFLCNMPAVIELGLTSLLPASGSGFVFAALGIWILNAIAARTEGSSEPDARELIGHRAKVTTPIQPEHVGQIAYVVRGSRFTAAARGAGGKPIPRDAEVTITRIDGGTFFVAWDPAEHQRTA